MWDELKYHLVFHIDQNKARYWEWLLQGSYHLQSSGVCVHEYKQKHLKKELVEAEQLIREPRL